MDLIDWLVGCYGGLVFALLSKTIGGDSVGSGEGEGGDDLKRGWAVLSWETTVAAAAARLFLFLSTKDFSYFLD